MKTTEQIKRLDNERPVKRQTLKRNYRIVLSGDKKAIQRSVTSVPLIAMVGGLRKYVGGVDGIAVEGGSIVGTVRFSRDAGAIRDEYEAGRKTPKVTLSSGVCTITFA